MRRIIGLLFLSAALSASAQAPRLVRDIDPTPATSNESSNPQGFNWSGFVRSGSFLYFRASTPATGIELFRTDGTEAGTRLVVDANPGPESGLRDQEVMTGADTGATYAPEAVDADGDLYFTAAVPNASREARALFRTDGNGVERVPDGEPAGTVFVSSLTAAGGRVYFLAEGPSGISLRVTDGTTTRVVANGRPVLAASPDGDLYYAQGGEVMRTSGAPNDARHVAYADGVFPLARHRFLFTSAGQLFAGDDAGVVSLGRTSMVSAVRLGDRVVFVPGDQSAPLWVTDATAAGTSPVGVTGVRALVGPAGGRVIVVTSGASGTSDLWSTDGTLVGARKIGGGLPAIGYGPYYSLRSAPAAGGAYLAFVGHSVARLWWTDGTETGTRFVSEVSVLDSPSFGALGDSLLFSGYDAVHRGELWTSDGTASGTHLLSDIAREPVHPGSWPASLTDAGGRLFFIAGVDGRTFTSDGTAAGTHPVGGASGALPPGLRPVATLGRIAYLNGDGVLWRSDGTDAGTFPVADGAGQAWESGGWIWFLRSDPDAPALWRLRGSVPEQVAVFSPLTEVQRPSPLADGGFVVLTWFRDWLHGYDSAALYRTDGTPAGTRLLRFLPGRVVPLPPLANGNPLYLASHALFPGLYGDGALWTSDGTEAGTRAIGGDLIPEVSYTPEAARARAGVVLANPGRLSLVGDDGRLTPLADMSAYGLVAAGDLVFFNGWTSDFGWRPWRTDGTPEGTFPVADLRPASAWEAPRFFPVGPRRVVFALLSPDTGRELWTSDGTREGTRLLADLRPGPASAITGDRTDTIAVCGSNIYFAADDGETGVELWAIPVSAVCDGAPCLPVSGGGMPGPVRR